MSIFSSGINSRINAFGVFGPPANGTPALGPTITAAPAISGTPEVGQTLTSTTGTWSGTGTITYAYQWTRNGADISGATSSTYTLVAADDDASIRCRVTATDDDGSKGATSNALSVTYAAPVAAGALGDQSYTQDTGNKTVDASGDFTGAVGGTWSVSGGGASIDSAGEVTIPSDTLLSAATITVTYTNSGGSDSSAFSVTVANVPGTMDAPTVTATGAGSVSADLDDAPAANNSAITQYDLRYSTDESAWTTVTDVSDPESITGLTGSTLYYVQTRAVNSIGSGAWSASGSATTEAGDVTAPTVSSAASNVAGDTITLTLTEAVTGTEATGDWDVNDVTGGSATVSSVDISGDTITLGLSGNLVNGDDSPTVDYTAGDIQDAAGNALATFANRAVTNNVPQFEVVVTEDNKIGFLNYDGRTFTMNGETYSFDPSILDTTQAILEDAALTDDGTPAVGETLGISRAIIAYDGAAGAVTMAIAASGTNSPSGDPLGLLVDAADAGTGLYVTDTATQAGRTSAVSTSNTVNIPSGSWTAPSVVAGDGQATVTVGSNQPAAPAAPTVVAGDAQATVTQG